MTHNLGAIVQKLIDSELSFPFSLEVIDALTPYGSIRRYEQGFFEITEEEVQQALALNRKVLKWVEEQAKGWKK